MIVIDSSFLWDISMGKCQANYSQENKNTPEREIRIINKAALNSYTDPLFRSSQILISDYVNNKLPISFDNIQINYETRQSNLMYIQRYQSCFSTNLQYITPNMEQMVKPSFGGYLPELIQKTSSVVLSY